MVRKPHGWDKCPPFGSKIDLFIPFKVPLDPHRFSSSDSNMFTLDTLLSSHPQIGLVIDLTNTDGYYSFDHRHVAYKKIECEGFRSPPSMSQVDLFIRTVISFCARNPGRLVGVHCTHGFNRTGFMIVSYLVRCGKYDLNSALSIFSEKRSPGIYKQVYILELMARFECSRGISWDVSKPLWLTESNANSRDFWRDFDGSGG